MGLTLYSLTFSIPLYVVFTIGLRYQQLHLIKGVYRTDSDACAEKWDACQVDEILETHGKRGKTSGA